MKYRHATMDDAYRLFSWRNDALTVANNRDNREVPLDEHLSWLSRQISEDDRAVLICEDAEGVPIGTVRFSPTEDGGFETGVTVAPEARGKGYGGKILKLVCDDRPEVTLYTEVAHHNIASMKAFGAAGFKQIGSYGLWTQWRRLPLK